jgi:hypothetical protein
MKRLSLLVICISCISFLTGCGAAALGVSAYTQVQVDAVTELLIEKGIITNEEFATKQKQIQRRHDKLRKSNETTSGTLLEQ